jgi:hypothetical protein
MRIEELTAEQIERAKKCETAEERMAFIQESGIELTDEQMEAFSGGVANFPWRKTMYSSKECPKAPEGVEVHNYQWTGRTRPGKVWGDVWPDYEQRCTYCGNEVWHWTK